MINRRGLITGLMSLVAAPAIVRAGSLMPVKNMLFNPEKILAEIYTSYDIGIMDKTCFATYMYMLDGSIKILELGYQDIYK